MKKIMYLLPVALLAIGSCEEEIPVPTSLYVGEETSFTLSANGGAKAIEVKTSAALTLEAAEVDWCTIAYDPATKTLTVTSQRNEKLAARTATATLVASDRSLDLTFVQDGQPSIAMPIDSAWTSTLNTGSDLGFSYDGDLGSRYYLSKVLPEGTTQHEFIYYLHPTTALALAGITYYPRFVSSTTPDGTFGNISIDIATTVAPTAFTHLMDYDCKKSTTTTFIEFPTVQTNVGAVKITVDGATSQGGRASMREIQFTAMGSVASTDKYLVLNQTALTLKKEGGETRVGVLSNSASFTVSGAPAWCTAEPDGNYISLNATPNSDKARRTATLTVTGSDGGTQTLTLLQLGAADRLAVSSVAASSEESTDSEGANGGPAAFAADGNKDTYWHSCWACEEVPKPHTITFTLSNVTSLEYIDYYPRPNATSASNGTFGKVKVWVKTAGAADFTEAAEFNCGQKGNTYTEMVLPEPIANVAEVKFELVTSVGGHGSCIEMEFYGIKK